MGDDAAKEVTLSEGFHSSFGAVASWPASYGGTPWDTPNASATANICFRSLCRPRLHGRKFQYPMSHSVAGGPLVVSWRGLYRRIVVIHADAGRPILIPVFSRRLNSRAVSVALQKMC